MKTRTGKSVSFRAAVGVLLLLITAAPAGVRAQESSFDKKVLVEDVTDPIELAVAPDGRVFFAERGGAVRVWDPETEATSTVGVIPVTNLNEDGLLGLTLDPDFAENGWIYLFYSPAGPEPVNELARFTVVDGRLDPRSKKMLLQVPVQRVECCHTGGSLAFGPDGNLFISTGDNTNPFASDGFAPIDERPGREPWDAQRSSGNTNDLRGKILRIRPLPDGTYEIPEGNLFPGGQDGLPEIYTMGHRNPYRISVDPETGYLYWGDVGPDAGAPVEGRGPAGHDEVGQARQAGNFGWPYFIGDNKAYWDYDFAAEASGERFDPQRPVNASPNNTGARVLPPAQHAFIWYPYGPSEEFPELEAGGRTAMAGPVYHYDPATAGPHALPASFDNTLFFYEWARNWIKAVRLDENGRVAKIEPFMPEETFIRPMDMELGPEGRLYVIEWGDAFWGNNENARIVRIDHYSSAARPPIAAAEVTPTSGPAPLRVSFDASQSQARPGDAPLTYTWDFEGDGHIDIGRQQAVYTYEEPGNYTARLTVTGPEGLTDVVEIPISVGNTAPVVSFVWPPSGGVFDFGEAIAYEVEVEDPEDAGIAAGRIYVQPYLGRDTHTLPLQPQRGSEGRLVVYPDPAYEYHTEQVVQLEARYADRGALGVTPQEGKAVVVLQPRRKQAEFAARLHEAERKTTGDIRTKEDLRTIVEVRDGSHLAYTPVNLLNIASLTFRVKPEAGGTLEVRLDAPDGPLLGQARVAAAGSPQAAAQPEEQGDVTTHDEMMHRLRSGPAPEGWVDVTVPVQDPGGARTLYLVFRGEGGETLMALDWIHFNGPGIGRRTTQGSR